MNASASTPPRAQTLGVIGCHACGLVCKVDGATAATAATSGVATTAAPTAVPTAVPTAAPTAAATICPRCNTALHRRKHNSIARGWALLVAALILYVPANLLPVLHTSLLGDAQDSTIMAGVVEFWHGGSYGIAALIFVASIAVPCTKFLVLGLLLWTSQRRSRWAMAERTRLYRLIELVGYWSMLDVLVVAIVAALVQFRGFTESEPRVGIFFFGMVVILTMLSAMSFDPRLIWDGDDR